MLRAFAAAAMLFAIVAVDAAHAQFGIPGGNRPGRERERFFDPVQSQAPRIQLCPVPMFETAKSKRPARRKKCRNGKRC
jgi:hypothetical protein